MFLLVLGHYHSLKEQGRVFFEILGKVLLVIILQKMNGTREASVVHVA